MSGIYLLDKPPLAYLALVPKRFRAQVAQWCRVSPTIGELRSVMLVYGELSEEVGRINFSIPEQSLYEADHSSIMVDFWHLLLLGKLTSPVQHHALSYRLGPIDVFLASGSALTTRSLSANGKSFTMVTGVAEPLVGIELSCVRRLQERLHPELKDSDVHSVGAGLLSVNHEYAGLANAVMSKFHLWDKVDDTSDPPSLDEKGFCYLGLFKPGMRFAISLAIGKYPTADLLAALYLAGLLYGFSVRAGVELKILDDVGLPAVAHLRTGQLSYSDLFMALYSFAGIVGIDVDKRKLAKALSMESADHACKYAAAESAVAAVNGSCKEDYVARLVVVTTPLGTLCSPPKPAGDAVMRCIDDASSAYAQIVKTKFIEQWDKKFLGMPSFLDMLEMPYEHLAPRWRTATVEILPNGDCCLSKYGLPLKVLFSAFSVLSARAPLPGSIADCMSVADNRGRYTYLPNIHGKLMSSKAAAYAINMSYGFLFDEEAVLGYYPTFLDFLLTTAELSPLIDFKSVNVQLTYDAYLIFTEERDDAVPLLDLHRYVSEVVDSDLVLGYTLHKKLLTLFPDHGGGDRRKFSSALTTSQVLDLRVGASVENEDIDVCSFVFEV